MERTMASEMERKPIGDGWVWAICIRCGSITKVRHNDLRPAVCNTCRRAESQAACDAILRSNYQEEHRAYLKTVRVTRTVDPATGDIIEWRK